MIGRLQKIKNIELTALKIEQCAMCPIKPVKHYFLACARVAKWLAFKLDSCTAHIRFRRRSSV